ncbi:hypothetical protein [Chelatococcus sp. YT9]|uniref:GCG_CRPN prefix-to-repeats domain-containing protein n=1 Tax=Chelatococcus sp. YT9 TaxID=2835635 RepID=UPI0020C0C784|nr:hypothetical protein [Chelatococcus sp. YT9]
MRRLWLGLVAGAALVAPALTPAHALPVMPALERVQDVMLVAEGCGWGRWRGPWGGCRDTPYYGPLPGGGWAGPVGGVVVGGNGCPPGFWRGPWGHCRDTPYHGPLPGGGWR